MRQADIEIGKTYRAKVSGVLVNVLVLRELEQRTSLYGCTRAKRFLVRNLRTGREVAMTAAKMRYKV